MLLRVPISTMSVKQLRTAYDPLEINYWCQHCSCPTEKQPCRRDKSPFTREEIAAAIKKQDFEPVNNERWGYNNTIKPDSDTSLKNKDVCNRARHIRRIAYLAAHFDGREPITMKDDKPDEIYDGGHRLAAALYRGLPTIQTRPKAEFDAEKDQGHLPLK